MKRRAFISIAVICLLVAALACTTKQAEIEAFGIAVEQTATARALTGEESGSANVATISAQSTEGVESLNVTQTAINSSSQEDQAGTATAQAPIIAELPTYGIDPAEGGKVAWIHPPEELVVDDSTGYDYINRFAGILARDFVLSGDITWNTEFGTSGCGFVIRSNGDKEALDGYFAVMTRGGNGTVFFSPVIDGILQSANGTEIDLIDQNFQWQNDTTNRLTVVARGSNFRIYTNGVFISEYNFSEFERGFVAMIALAESGVTRCQFTNTWLWLISQ